MAATPYIMGKGGIECDQVQEGMIITGVDGRDRNNGNGNRQEDHLWKILPRFHGRPTANASLPSVIIGIGLADKMGVRPGARSGAGEPYFR